MACESLKVAMEEAAQKLADENSDWWSATIDVGTAWIFGIIGTAAVTTVTAGFGAIAAGGVAVAGVVKASVDHADAEEEYAEAEIAYEDAKEAYCDCIEENS